MASLLVAKSVLATLVRRPLWWVCALLLALSWPAFRTFLPLGLVSADLHHWTASYETAFLGGGLGILGAMGILTRTSGLLHRAHPSRRLRIEVTALMASALALGAFALVPAHAFGTWQFPTFRVEQSILALLVGWLHVSTVAAAALRIPMDRTSRAVCVGLGVGVLPGLLPGVSHFDSALLTLLDAGGTLRASFDFPLSLAHWIAAAVPIAGWGAVALALASPPDPFPSAAIHALRDPR